MTERPILFSAEMVGAILDGRKTQTRRVMKNPPSDERASGSCWFDDEGDAFVWLKGLPEGHAHGIPLGESRYGEPGDTLWVPGTDPIITLRITDIRVERLHEITEADAMAEGASPVLVPPDGGSAPHVEGFRDLWNTINGPGAWEANPWVWVVCFERWKP
jgi:hypothetical protein